MPASDMHELISTSVPCPGATPARSLLAAVSSISPSRVWAARLGADRLALAAAIKIEDGGRCSIRRTASAKAAASSGVQVPVDDRERRSRRRRAAGHRSRIRGHGHRALMRGRRWTSSRSSGTSFGRHELCRTAGAASGEIEAGEDFIRSSHPSYAERAVSGRPHRRRADLRPRDVGRRNKFRFDRVYAPAKASDSTSG